MCGYGYYESKIQFAPGSKMWQTFWMFGGGSSNYREIDISEKYTGLSDFESSINLHNQNGSIFPNSTADVIPSSTSLTSSFHTYAVEWSPLNVILYFDSKIVKEFHNNNDLPFYDMWVYLVSGPGNQPITSTNPGSVEMYIDYIRVYNLKKGNCTTTQSTILNNTDLNNFNFQLYKNINIGNASSTINLPNTARITFRATDNVNISGDFYVPIGAEFGIYPTPCSDTTPF